jgi:hypothetical protein
MHTLCSSILEPTAKANHAVVSVPCKVFGNLKTIFIVLLRVFPALLMYLRHSDVNYKLGTGTKITGSTNSFMF